MPAIRKIAGPRGKDFWSSFPPDEYRLVAETLKEEFQRSEPAYDIHWAQSGPDHIPPTTCNVRISFHCFHDCLLFLLRGIIFIEGQGALTEPGYAYAVKNEKWIGLGGNTTVFVMEEGEMKGICSQKTKEAQEQHRKEKEAAERKGKKPWNRALGMFRREEQEVQCATQ